MKRILLLVFLLATAGCLRPPEILPPEGGGVKNAAAVCRKPFPVGNWRFMHSVFAHMPDGRYINMIGVTIIHPAEEKINVAILTVEGAVLFEAIYDKTLDVLRASPAFDSPGFAEGLIEDIRLMFFSPRNPPVETGVVEADETICRYEADSGEIIDIIQKRENLWRILRYDRKSRLLRTVEAWFPDRTYMYNRQKHPEKYTLRSVRPVEYKLDFELISAEPLDE